MRGFRRIIWPLGFVLGIYLSAVFAFGLLVPTKFARLSNLGFDKSGYGHLFLRNQEAKTVEKTDVLIFGSSHAYRGFDPRIFQESGINIFNFGSSSQTPVQSEYLCEKYLDQMNPRWVLIETYPPLFSNDGVESTLDLISNTSINPALVSMATETPDPRIVNGFLYKWMLNWTNQQRESQSVHRDKDTYINGGYVQIRTDTKPGDKVHDDQPIQIIPSQREALIRILEYCAQRDVNVLLLQAPVSESYYRSLKGMDAFNREMEKLAPYINYNGKLPLADSLHFYDHHHLNQAGVESFNRAVIDDLRELMEGS